MKFVVIAKDIIIIQYVTLINLRKINNNIDSRHIFISK